MAGVFPQSGDENVEIHLTSDKSDKILLHSYVLALHSTWFKASLSERWNGGTAASEGKNRWVYELRFDKGDAFGLLARRVEDTDNPPPTTATETISRNIPSTASDPNKELHKERLRNANAHRQMLGALYHINPTFSHESFVSAMASITSLAKAADAYDCQQIIKIHTENHLRLYRDEVLDVCLTNPLHMLELATSLRSEWIFMEASTHLIGRSKAYYGTVEPRLREMNLLELFQKKRVEFREKLFTTEMALFMIQPTTRIGWGAQTAVDFFRQGLSEQLAEGAGSNMGKGYAAVYHDIIASAARGTILWHTPEVAQFLNRPPHTTHPNIEPHLTVTRVGASKRYQHEGCVRAGSRHHRTHSEGEHEAARQGGGSFPSFDLHEYHRRRDPVGED